MSSSRRRLSRRLSDAFTGSDTSELGGASALFDHAQGHGHFRHIPIDRIRPGGERARRSFDPEALDELASSIRAHGVLQPIRVRSSAAGRYEIIAGERRWLAARQAGLRQIPALIATSDDEHAFVESLVENIQREDLNVLDRADALRRLRVNLGLQSWEEVGAVVGITRQHVYNLLRVTQLPEPIQDDVRAGELSEKHGRALLLLRSDPDAQNELWEQIRDDDLSGEAAILEAQRLRGAAPVAATARRDVRTMRSEPPADDGDEGSFDTIGRAVAAPTARRVVDAVSALVSALAEAPPEELVTARRHLEDLHARLGALLTAPPASRERVAPHDAAAAGEGWHAMLVPVAGNPTG